MAAASGVQTLVLTHLGELDDQDCVLAGEAHQHEERDLR